MKPFRSKHNYKVALIMSNFQNFQIIAFFSIKCDLLWDNKIFVSKISLIFFVIKKANMNTIDDASNEFNDSHRWSLNENLIMDFLEYSTVKLFNHSELICHIISFLQTTINIHVLDQNGNSNLIRFIESWWLNSVIFKH